MKILFISLTLSLLIGCTSQKTSTTDHAHTLKLKTNLSISFRKIDQIKFTFNNQDYSDVHIKILAAGSAKQKIIIMNKYISSDGDLNFTLPPNLNQYNYLVAIINAIDKHGNKISASKTYHIREQKAINKAKEQLRK